MSSDWRFEIADVENLIQREIAAGLTQKQIAQTYRLALQSSWPTDWAKVNAMITARWPKGLNRVEGIGVVRKVF